MKRILCPAKDAFERYVDIMCAARKYGSNKLILVALGQTATVLSYDLAKLGYWAIDIGHVDIEYEWFLRGAKDKLPIAGKYVNEAKYDVFCEKKIQDENYEKTIVERIPGLSCLKCSCGRKRGDYYSCLSVVYREALEYYTG